MTVRLVFLGRLEDVAGTPDRVVEPGVIGDVIAGFPLELRRAVSAERVRIAVNGRLLADPRGVRLLAGDELAFLPPVSGG